VQKRLIVGYDHGDEMSEWKWLRLGDICVKIGSGATPRGGSSVYLSEGVTLIRSQNVYNNRFEMQGLAFIEEKHALELLNVTVEVDDILLNITGDSVARTCQVPSEILPARVNQHVAIIRPSPSTVDARFLKYSLVNPTMQQYMLSIAGAGATRNALTKGMIENFKILTPPLPIQHAIVHILGSLDDKIELNRRMNETLEAMARALFKDWFVEFGPVRAKMEGRQPPGLSAEIAALFPDALDAEDKPVGWEMKSFVTTINLIGGGTPKTSEPAYWGGEIPWFSVVDVPRDGDVFTIDTEKKITERGLSESATRLLSPGTTIISARGTVGKCALVGVPMAMNQSCYGVIGKEGRGSYFTHFSLRYLVTELQQNTHGSVFDTITQATFQTVHVPTIPIPLTQAFDHTVSSFLQRILTNLHESRTLAALRDLLLPKLLSGELRVRVAEEIVEGAR